MIDYMTDRRRLLQIGSMSTFAATFPLSLPLSAHAATASARPIRDTAQGPVRGEALSDCLRFLGIPFAAPPTGPRRFRRPEPPLHRDTMLDATAFAPSPIQKDAPAGLYGPGPFVRSEDCLYLNVWTPHGPGPHPVYVWVHGGGNVAGSSRMPVFDGSRFARQGIVCVTISYRVGALGFLDLGLRLGSDFHASGNNGLLDIVEALRWVHANIAGFGGDTARVTLGGQSAGAKNVCTLLAMPAARGLFHNAIVESGGAQTAATTQVAEEMTDRFLELAGLSNDPSALLTLPVDKLLDAQGRLVAGWRRKYPFRAVIDGTVLPCLPLASPAPKIPLLIGWARDDVAFFGPNAAHDGSVTQGELANMALEDFQEVYAGYPDLMPERSPVDRRYAALTAEEYGIPSLRAAASHAAAGGSTWVWRLDMPRAKAPNAGYSVHGSELPLVWDKVDDPLSSYLGPDGAPGSALSAAMRRTWRTFIRSGKASWPAYEPKQSIVMCFADHSTPYSLRSDPEMAMWARSRFDTESIADCV